MNSLPIKSGVLLVLLFLVYSVRAQLTEHYFTDTSTANSGSIICSIHCDPYTLLGGENANPYLHQSCITKVDSNGNLVWTTGDTDTSVYNFSQYRDEGIKEMVWNDSVVYAYNLRRTNNYLREIWKVDYQSGQILWKKPFFIKGWNFSFFKEYDATKLLMGYEGSGRKGFAFISKLTGDTLSTHQSKVSGDSRHFVVDSAGDMYSCVGDSLFKISGANPDSIIWRVGYAQQKDLREGLFLYLDSANDLYLYGKDRWSPGLFMKINPANGAVVHDENINVDYNVAHCIDHKGGLVFLFRHSTVGGSTYYFKFSRFNKSTLKFDYHTQYSFKGQGNPGVRHGDEQGPLDVEMVGDMAYITGYYGDANTGPGCWGNLKMNTNNGQVLWESTITRDTSRKDLTSDGHVINWVNGKLLVFGDLEYTATDCYHCEKTWVTAAELDTTTGAPSKVRRLGLAGIEYPSSVIEIKKNGNHTYVLKQEGNRGLLEKYDFNQNLQFRTWLDSWLLMRPLGFDFMPNGDVLIMAYDIRGDSKPPYIDDNPTDFIFMQVNDSGQIVRSKGTSPSYYYGFPFQLIPDSTTPYILVKGSHNGPSTDMGQLYNSNSIGKTGNIGGYHEKHSIINQTVQFKAGTFYYFSENEVLEVVNYKSTRYDYFSALTHSNEVLKVSPQEILITGKDVQGRACLVSYNLAGNNTNWISYYAAQSETYRLIYSHDSSAIFMVGMSQSHLDVYKVSAQNGSIIWRSSYTGPLAHKADLPTSLAEDPKSKQLYVGGMQMDTLQGKDITHALILTFDSVGNPIDTLVKRGNLGLDSKVNCIERLPNGRIWAGGEFNHSSVGKAGVLFGSPKSSYFLKSHQVSACRFYKLPGGKFITQSGVYFDTLSSSGVDTIHQFHLTILPVVYTTVQAADCKSYTSPSGRHTWTVSGNYNDTLQAVSGCDSILNINLTINTIYQAPSQSIKTCNSYTSPSGNYTWTTSGTYRDTSLAGQSCDTAWVFQLTIDTLATGQVVQNGQDLETSVPYTTYQWLDCNQGYARIQGELNRTFSPAQFGNYAVQVSQGSCRDTLACFTYASNSIEGDKADPDRVQVYPNPVKESLTISFVETLMSFELMDAQGRMVRSGVLENKVSTLDFSSLPVGVYTLHLQGNGEPVIKRITRME
ncbi:T9SS type A sorting domain-containing protein [bacterium SCSIO 12741]|nr:T9SS type A sorting domain-containing protein [bacterium SCSIO 12741]